MNANPATLNQRLAVFNAATTCYKTSLQGNVPLVDGYMSQPQLQLSPACMGVVLGFLVRVKLAVKNTGTSALKLTTLGLSNFIETIEYVDPNGLSRVKTSGALLEALTTARLGRAVGASNQVNPDYPIIPSGSPANSYPAAGIEPSEVKSVSYVAYMPLTRHNSYEGAVVAFTSGSQQFINLTWRNRTVLKGANVDATDAAFYQDGATPCNFEITKCEYEVVTINKDFMISQDLPFEIFGKGYFVQEQVITGLSEGGELQIPLTFNREYFNSIIQVDNGGRLYAGTDLTKIGAKAGASQIITDLSPDMFTMKNSTFIENNLPKGHYWFNYPVPVNVNYTGGQYNLFVVPKTVNSGARVRVLSEYSNPYEQALGTVAQ